jgi:Inositol-pentakisphosphate 2-kinase
MSPMTARGPLCDESTTQVGKGGDSLLRGKSSLRAVKCHRVDLLAAPSELDRARQAPRIYSRLMALRLSETSPAEWKYISEGGATIVFSYQGPCHPILTGKVLRLSKTPREGPLCVSDDNPQLAVESQQKVISRLLSPSYLVDLQVVPLEAQWVEAFAVHHESSRPQERRSTSMINLTGRTGVLAPDLIGGLSCAVEIKVNSSIVKKS